MSVLMNLARAAGGRGGDTLFTSDVKDVRALIPAYRKKGKEERVAAIRVLTPAKAAELFGLLEPEEQAELVRRLDNAELVNLLQHLADDDLVAIFDSLPRSQGERMRARLSSLERERIDRMLRWPTESAGRNMNPECIRLPHDITVAEAIQGVRSAAALRDDVSVVTLQDERRRFVGSVPLARLFSADPNARVDSIATEATLCVRPDTPAVQAARQLREWHLKALPVVSEKGEVLGILDREDALDILEEFESELMYGKAGVAHRDAGKDMLFSRRLTQGTIWYPVRVRIAFLMVTLAGGFAVGGLIDTFEGVLEAILVAAIFIPVIMDMGGNVGTQSTTIFARGFALGHINLDRFKSYMFREVSIGLTMGAMLGLIAGFAAWAWQGAPNGVPEIGIAVGISIFTVVTVGCLLGFVLPYILIKMGLDHAPGADPFITTIKDFTGLTLYFILVATLIGITDPDGACLTEADPCSVTIEEVCDDRDGVWLEDVECEEVAPFLAR